MKKTNPIPLLLSALAAFAALSASVLTSASALADDQKPGGKPGVPGNSRPVSFDEMRARCDHPEQFDVQRAPQNIRFQCTDIQRDFVAAAPGEVPLDGHRRVVTAVFSDKFHVAADEREVPMFQKAGSCLRFKEVERVLTVERPMTCQEVMDIKGDANDFCTTMVDAAKGANPKLIEVRDTGKMIDTCGGGGDGSGKPGPK